ncbi:MAG: bifunctional oligoribonuclease/PAP phosphatase NrnA [Ruminococcus sp.]|nr:bifunctional oligoribonuclease/PAP phosphatase NrnA [Ruminococcus sp.]
MTTLYGLAKYFSEHDNYEIITHNYPDGDTLGSGFALCLGLQQIGKKARVITTSFPSKFRYLEIGVEKQEFEAETIIAVDVANESLLGVNTEKYKNIIDVCIDHHGSNSVYAKEKYVDRQAAANCEIIYRLLQRMNVRITRNIADCLFTGVSTDTGCFRYSNTTSETMRIAADLMEYGCSFAYINKVMFETKTKEKIQLERAVLDTITYAADGQCALIYTTLDMMKSLNIGDDEMEGLASIPRQIEGVRIGITMREKEENVYKISVRTNGNLNASDFCSRFGGGGHPAAAGCTIKGEFDFVRKLLISAAELALK